MKKLGALIVSFGLFFGAAMAQEDQKQQDKQQAEKTATININEGNAMCQSVSSVLEGVDGIVETNELAENQVQVTYNEDDITLEKIEKKLKKKGYKKDDAGLGGAEGAEGIEGEDLGAADQGHESLALVCEPEEGEQPAEDFEEENKDIQEW